MSVCECMVCVQQGAHAVPWVHSRGRPCGIGSPLSLLDSRDQTQVSRLLGQVSFLWAGSLACSLLGVGAGCLGSPELATATYSFSRKLEVLGSPLRLPLQSHAV